MHRTGFADRGVIRRTKVRFLKNFSIAALCFPLAGWCGVFDMVDVASEATTIPDDGQATEWVYPTVRSHPLPRVAGPSMVPRSVATFAVQPVVVGADALASAPRVVAGADGRAYFGKNDVMYAQGALQGTTEFRIVRRGLPLQDPISKAYLGDEIMQLGSARLHGDAVDGAQRFLITEAGQEIVVGDLLLPVLSPQSSGIMPYAAHRSTSAGEAVIVSIFGGVAYAAPHQLVSINRGALHGVSEGALFAVYAAATPPLSQEELRASLMIVSVFEHVSYGVIMSANDVVQVGDKARAPE